MVLQHLYLALLWLLFCVLHSVLASAGLKQRLINKLGNRFKYYRLFYTLFAFLTLGIVVYYQLNIFSPFVFERNWLTNIAGGIASVVGLIIMGVCIKKYFLSLSGLKSLFQESPTAILMISGIHRYVRHPLYAGTFLAIWGIFLLLPYLSLLIANFIITVYTLIGIELEEKKLIAEFGADYKKYRQTVPKLFPLPGWKQSAHHSTPK